MPAVHCPGFIYLDLGRVIVDFDHAIAWENVAALTGLAAADVQRFSHLKIGHGESKPGSSPGLISMPPLLRKWRLKSMPMR